MSREQKILVVACLVIAFVCNASDHNGVETDSVETITPSEVISAQPGEPDTIQTDTHIFEKIADDVYFATAAGTVHLVSNSLVVINEEDVLVVDSHITADAAQELLSSINTLTEKPVRYLVNSHFHFDHAHGNQAFPEGVDIIGHEYTRSKLTGDPLSEPTYQVIGSPQVQSQQLAVLDEQIKAAADTDAASSLKAQKAMLERHIVALDEVEPTPPNVTFTDRLSIFRGSREIQLFHPGRGHTGGDVLVYLPKERVLFTGDLLYPWAPYLGDAFADEFPDTLEHLKELDIDVIAGGHGPLIKDTSIIDLAQSYLRSYWDQVSKFHSQGLTVAETLEALDLSDYEDFAVFQLNTPGVLELEVGRMYERLEEPR